MLKKSANIFLGLFASDYNFLLFSKSENDNANHYFEMYDLKGKKNS